MSSSIATEDLRSIKTERALFAAMFSLLENHNFKRITVKGICEKSLISRAAFYAHFIDKYDLLKHWLLKIWSKHFDAKPTFEALERLLNEYIHKNTRIIKNLIYDADNETFEILFDFILSTQGITIEKNSNIELFQKNVALSNFCAGGIISYLIWQIKNMFPSDVPLINKHIFAMLTNLQT